MPADDSKNTDLTMSGKRSRRGSFGRRPSADHREVGHRHAMVSEELLRQRLVARQNQAARIAAGVRQVQQLEVADDVLVEGGDARERLQQVEHDVRIERLHRGADAAQVVVHAAHAHLVPDLAQRLDDVELHLPLGLAHVDSLGVAGRHEVVVHERQQREPFS